MTSQLTYVGALGLAACASIVATPAFANGTTAGTTITNTATVDYQVGGVAQGRLSASSSFIVDRKINLLVEEEQNLTTDVSPGQANVVTTFQLTNSSNEILDFLLTAQQITGTTATHGGTDTFDVTNVRIYRDAATGPVGTYDPGDALVTYIDELATDTPIRLFVVADVPAGLPNLSIAGIHLRATALEGGTAGTQGVAVSQTAGADTAGKDTVFADGVGSIDQTHDASHSDADDYTVRAATLTVTKSSRVISDPINGSTNPKLIPGATVEYCIAVANAAGSAAATSVTINDSVPGQLVVSTATIKANGTMSAGVCAADGDINGTYSNPVVSGTIPGIAAGTTRTLVFQAVLN